MGSGSYNAGDWARLKASRSIGSSSTTGQLFVKNRMDPRFDPKFINKRESRDSEEHPESTPIMIGVDVTGSMGYLSTQIIKESLNDLMMKLYSSDLVKDPQLLFAAIGDATADQAPLQVTQFESDIRIAEQLLDLWLENGGGDGPEDYQLLWWFAAKHTDIDSYRKRGKKGFCFTIGDASFHESLSADSFMKVFGDKAERKYSSRELATLAGEQYELFHIMIGSDAGNVPLILPGRVITVPKGEIQYLPEIIISVMQLSRGVDKAVVLDQWGTMARSVVSSSINLLRIDNGKNITF